MDPMNHLGGSIPEGDLYTHTPDIWGWLLLEYDIRSMVDIGCGYGWNANWFRKMGVKTMGVEGDLNAIMGNVLPRDNLVVHDYTLGALKFAEQYDLALCTEFVEHVEAQYEPNWMATLDSANLLLMCHATPGQPGYHHVNCQDSDYWINRLYERDFVVEPAISERFQRTTSRVPSGWGRNTMLFFRRVR
jgi:SAM-dependent methyltransferase